MSAHRATPPERVAAEIHAPERARFERMDALRAIAAFCVVGYHLTLQLGWLGWGVATDYLVQLDVGVPIFFVISAFLLYRRYVLARVQAGPEPPLGPYAVRRVARIVPAYWVALAVITVVLGMQAAVFTPGGIVRYFGFLQVYATDTVGGGLPQAWSLCVEVVLYAFLPAWGFVLWRAGPAVLRTELGGCGLLFAIGVVWKLAWGASMVITPAHPYPVAAYVFPNYLDVVALGMALAVVSAAGSARWHARLGRRPGLWWAFALACFAVAGAKIGPLDGETVVSQLLRHELKGLVAVGLIVPVVFTGTGGGLVRRLLARPGFLWLGVVSYGVFLWHFAVTRALLDAGVREDAVVVVLTLFVTVAIAAVSWRVVERPILDWAHRRTRATPDAEEAR